METEGEAQMETKNFPGFYDHPKDVDSHWTR